MAKPKENPEQDNVTFLGKDIDPALQHKVEAYMEEPRIPENPEGVAMPKGKSSIKVIDGNEPVSEMPVTSGAPLLPTSELPDLEKKPTPKSSKIAVKIHEDEPAEEQVEPVPEEEPSEVAEEEPTPDLPEEPVEAEELDEEVADDQAVDEPEAEPEEPSESEAEEEPQEESLEPDENETEPDVEPELTPEDEPEPVDADDEKVADDLGLETAQTAHAVEDIIATEADEILAAEDQKKAPVAAASREGLGKKLKKFFVAWAKTPRYRNATILCLVLLVAVLGAVPSTRYFALNHVGVRASLSTKILDDKTGQPLKNVDVSIGSESAKSDIDGNVKLQHIKLGSQKLLIKKPAFAEVTRAITVGWGSNPQQETRLTPIGTQYSFLVTDFLSGKPAGKVEASSGDSSARSNEKGEIVLTVPVAEKDELEVQIAGESYRTEKVTVSTTKNEQQKLQLVPARKQSFVSKRSGKFDLYKVDIDGKNEEKVLAGTGLEREDAIALVPHPRKEIVAFVSTRDNVRNQDGYLLNTLSLVDLATNEVTKLGQSERIQIIDWIGTRLVYVKIAQGQSAASPQRHRLVSYDTETSTEKELASTNYFNDVVSARGSIYYAPAVYKVNGSVGLFKISADGQTKRTIYEKEVWNLFRTSYDKIAASSGQAWYELNLGNDGFTKSNGAPPVLKSRVYVDSQNGKQSLWVDERDGKGVLIAYDTETKQEKTLQTQGGLKNPIRWLDNEHIVYRVSNGQETADYAISLDGGEAKKVRDVTNSAGIDRWYYY